MEFKSKIKTIEWVDGYSRMVDQTVIPYEYKFINVTSGDEMFNAIRTMIVRGAPAIGIAGAHGVVLYAQEGLKKWGAISVDEFKTKLIEKAEYMKTSRPTAVNLMWACEKQIDVIRNSKSDITGLIKELTDNAIKLENEDIEIKLNETLTLERSNNLKAENIKLQRKRSLAMPLVFLQKVCPTICFTHITLLSLLKLQKSSPALHPSLSLFPLHGMPSQTHSLVLTVTALR